MKKIITLPLLLILPIIFNGCATTRAVKPKPIKPEEQIVQLQQELMSRDQEIAQLQQELEYHRSSSYSSEAPSRSSSSSGSVIRVSGVTATQLQKALKNAGYNPGTVDGRIGSQTKDAIKRFQRQKGIRADGVIGKKTWQLLKNEGKSYQ